MSILTDAIHTATLALTLKLTLAVYSQPYVQTLCSISRQPNSIFRNYKMFLLPDSENRVIVASFISTKHQNVTKGQTDGRTDGQTRSQLIQRSHCKQCGPAVTTRITTVVSAARCLHAAYLTSLYFHSSLITADCYDGLINMLSDNMLRTVFMLQCSAVDLVYHLFDVYVGQAVYCIFTAIMTNRKSPTTLPMSLR